MLRTTLLMSMLIPTLLAAQDRIPVELKPHRIYVSIIEPGINWEGQIAQKQTFVLGLGLTTLTDRPTNAGPDEIGISLNPLVTGEIRNYYNRKRIKKILNVNSGNYLALRAGYYFGALTDNVDSNATTETSKSFFMGPVWGIQRNYNSGIHLGLSLGGGFATGKHTDLKFSGIGQFKFGFALGR